MLDKEMSLKEFTLRFFIIAGIALAKSAFSFFVAWLNSLWLVPMAFAERGYEAAGGEWILIIASGIITYYGLTQLVNAFR
jgi:hypothetical protein